MEEPAKFPAVPDFLAVSEYVKTAEFVPPPIRGACVHRDGREISANIRLTGTYVSRAILGAAITVGATRHLALAPVRTGTTD